MKCIDRRAQFGYSALGCQCRLNKGGTLFRRTRYQQGSLAQEERKRGFAVWVYRWWEKDINGKPVRRKLQIGSSEQYPTESAAQAAADALRLTITILPTAGIFVRQPLTFFGNTIVAKSCR